MDISLSPFAPENLVSQEWFDGPVPRPPAHSILRLNLALTRGIPPDFRDGVHLFFLAAIRHRVNPEFIGSRNCVLIAFRPINLNNVVPVTGATFASPWTNKYAALFFLTHYWYEVGMLKVPAVHIEERRTAERRAADSVLIKKEDSIFWLRYSIVGNLA